MAVSGQPSWSPDGTQLLINGETDGVADIYVVSRADGRATRLTRGTEGLR